MEEKFELSCPHCGASGKASISLIGSNVKCQRCSQTFKALRDGVTEIFEEAATTTEPVPEEPTHQAQDSEPALPDAEPPNTGVKTVKANRVLAGKACPQCKIEVLLGEEVVLCDRCEAIHHAHCWLENGGCSSSRCVDPNAEGDSPSNRPCPACAERIPVDSKECPYCAEPIEGDDGGGLLPVSFTTGQGDLFVPKWNFTASSTELVGSYPGKGEIQVPRDRARSEITLTPRKMVIVVDGKRRKFTLDDIGHMAMRCFLNGTAEQKSSVVARDALIYAIVGMFCCQIVLGPYAIIRAGRAKEMMNLYPEGISGRGIATAAQVIGAIDLVLFVIYVVSNMMNATG